MEVKPPGRVNYINHHPGCTVSSAHLGRAFLPQVGILHKEKCELAVSLNKYKVAGLQSSPISRHFLLMEGR